ncbi:metallophosphoesterase [uncultured Dokdonia sp.]|mgnify:CR=1 FL=1|uniref:metallophosphoesterase n=1 Tax=uncultured Dokdonia sp. TaxID=575653 RepID=UPI002625C203|nr:metallophosphoesterase [uncultured Dokdonia sp.]
MKIKYTLVYSLFLFFLFGCATYAPQYAEVEGQSTLSRKRIPATSFYLIGDAGGAKANGSTDALIALKKVIDTAKTQNDYTIFLGDNIYPEGLPVEGGKGREAAEHKLQAQVDAVSGFKGEVVFIPGNHDWYSQGLNGLKRQEKFIEDALNDKEAFQPENGCPIESISISDEIELIIIDTQWYLENWDRNPTMNDECEIRTRTDFFLEIESEFKKNNEKTILVAMHHPMYTNGIHGGAFAIEKHLFPFQSNIPLPGLASLVTQVRGQGGVSIQDKVNKRYTALMDRLATLSYDTNKVIFVSGHEHSLQYIEHDGIKQIVSGAGAKKSAARLRNDGLFAYGGQGFAILDIYEDGASEVRYYSAVNGEPALLFEKKVFDKDIEYDVSGLPSQFEPYTEASIYSKEEVDKSDGFKKLWGNHYRSVYGTKVKVPVLTLDTLKGGITIDRKGGGHQTRSLRLVDPDGRNFALRAVKKSAVQFLQSVVFKDNFIQEEFRDTFTEDVILDFYTSSHPYATLAVGTLADAIDVYHTNPELVWMPKHPALGKYNEDYGDELYVIEERPDDGFIDVPSFGTPDKIESTSDLLENLRDDEEYKLDESSYIRARLFDMLIGDWDRHADQWRWARFDTKDRKVYKPIPRDRDQVFSNYDGTLLSIAKALIPPARQFQTYGPDLKNIEWMNIAGSKLDIALLPNATRKDWLAQAAFIRENLSDAAIDEAFLKFPKEVQDEKLEDVKQSLKLRRENLLDIASEYFDQLSKLVVIKGTDKDDHFEITREANGTRIQVSRIKGGKVMKPFIDRLVDSKETKEIWVYGLDDDDTFHVSGKGKKPIFMRIIGGQNNDVYTIDDGRRLKVYDHKTKPNTVVKKGGANFKRSNIYTNNTYDFNKTITNVNSILPSIGFNPDDGISIGLLDTYTIKGFKNDPYHRKHVFKAGYFFATSGFDLSYDGEFANSLGLWNLKIGARFTSENFALNFFGFGNESVNMDDELDFDFNRVRTGINEVHFGIVKDNDYGSRLGLITKVERIEIENNDGRFITQAFDDDSTIFSSQFFAGVEGSYEFLSANNPANPSKGMEFLLKVGSKVNLEDTDRIYGYVSPTLGFYNALSRNKKLVLKTKVQGQFNIGDSFEFYQGATLGARNGLRGFRNERFTGESAIAGSADLRYSFNRFKTGLLPIQIGIFGGADVGRVWLDGEDSDIWHNSLGGGFWINAVDILSGQFGAFNSDDGLRINFGFGVRL